MPWNRFPGTVRRSSAGGPGHAFVGLRVKLLQPFRFEVLGTEGWLGLPISWLTAEVWIKQLQLQPTLDAAWSTTLFWTRSMRDPYVWA